MKTLLRLIPLLTIGLFIDYVIVVDADSEFIFKGMMLGFVGIIFFILFLWVIYRDGKQYQKTSSKYSFIPTIAGVLLIISFFITTYVLSLRDQSPTLIHAGYDGGYNGAWFEFREDGTYKFANSGGIGAEYFRGTYTITDTIIMLDKTEIDNVIQSNLLAIRYDSTYPEPAFRLYQINNKHTIVDKNFVFTISLDNRKK
jgi:hypothetical protein